MMSDGRRPRDLALLLLATGDEPPRQRARDQQADRAGADLRRTVLQRLIEIDPSAEQLESTLAQILDEKPEPKGPTRAIVSAFAEEWKQADLTPKLWDYLLAQAIERGQRA